MMAAHQLLPLFAHDAMLEALFARHKVMAAVD